MIKLNKNINCSLITIILIWFLCNNSISLAYTGRGNPSDIKANSYINSPIGLFPGTGTTGSASTSARFRWYYGTTSTTGTGSTGFFNPGSSTMTAGLPYIDFLYSNGTSTINFSGFNNVTIDGIAITTGILTDYIKSLNGTATGLVGTNTTLNGTTTIPSTGVFSVNGRVLTDIELSYLDGLSDFLPTLLAGKQADLGGTYCASISDDVGTQTGAVRLGVSGDLTLVKTGNRFIYGLIGSASTKPDIKEGGTTVTVNSGFQNYNASDFDAIPEGTGTIIALSLYNHGTTTPTTGYVPVGDANGKLNSWIHYSGNDQYTKLLLHGDEVGSLSTYLDSSEQEFTVSSIGGTNGTITQSVFGGASFAFDGANDALSIADNERLELGSSDFMLDMRVRFIQANSPYWPYLIEKGAIHFNYNPTLSQITFSDTSINVGSGSWTASLNTWYHLAVIRKASKFRFYVDGSQIGSDAIDADAFANNVTDWNIGRLVSDSNGFYGYLDEIRITIGTGRKPSGTFTVNTEPYGSFTATLSN